MNNKNAFLRLSIQDQILFAKRLSLLIRAGVPIVEGLRMVERQSKQKATKQILQQVVHDVENGQFLSASIARYKKIFGDFAIHIIQVGEISGTLHENLNYLAEELKKRQALRRKIVGALIYPIFIILATFGVTALLTIYVFPKILPIFKSFKTALPWTTQVLIFVSSIFLHHSLLIVFLLIIFIVSGLLLLKISRVRFAVHRAVLFIPIVGRMMQSYYVSSLCRTLGLLLKSNVRIVKAVMVTADASTNLVYKKSLASIAEAIARGERISTSLGKNPALFPSILTEMTMVGENTGNLSATLLFLADMYEEEVDELTKNLSNVLEPALMIFMGVLVGFIAISIITPIYGITQSLHP